MNLTELLTFTYKMKASDLHISSGETPMVRIDGELRRIDLPRLSKQDTFDLIYSVMNEEQQKLFETNWENDFSIEIKDLARFRVNAYNQNRGPSAAFRIIPSRVQSLEELNMPQFFADIASVKNGLVLVTGPTGSGKSTTLAAMVDHVNRNRQAHILTIEDPIEFVHEAKRSLINQREVHRDTQSFKNALRSALREDPDVILVGELRDTETISLALTAAETGHLVFGTLHTMSAAKTVNRIVDVFPQGEKDLVRTMLSESLQAVISQLLAKKPTGGRVPLHEIMRCTPAIRNLIRENKVPQIYSMIQTSNDSGMQTLDQHIRDLLNRGMIDNETAQFYSNSNEEFA